MRSQLSHFVLWVAASQSVLFSPFVQAHDEGQIVHGGFLDKRATKHVWPIDEKTQKIFNKIQRSPAHQNPEEAPPVHIPADAIGMNKTRSNYTAASHLQTRNVNLFQKRDALRCDNGPCIDGSCCGKNNICGYGPDYCGEGCQSLCEATAMCGEFSENADMPCGMKLCCSATGWCGTTEVYCDNADPLHKTLPCQAGYGSCAITGPPACAKGSGGSSARTIGYYQSWNVRTRLCNKVSPKQLDTSKYTHIFFSFAFIDPASFKIAPAHPDDIELMKEFTSLASSKLKTWIAIGGFDFSNPEVATHKTWSETVSTKANRAAFISSVKEYMDTFGFSGVDLDWEYPGDPKRGGNKLADTRNLVSLVREMRAAYGQSYGISLTLAPDYWYLRWFDAKAMEQYVDFFGFMAYDLHGSWDADVLTLGKKVRGQADIREIRNNTVPLWFDGLNPQKLNFGLAMYGRGYTLSDPSCNQLLCGFSGPSNPAPCTGFGGVMSLLEIQQLIKKKNLKPQYLPDSMMKQITWDDQWIGYDDDETFAAKRAFADSLCFGGTMIWSIDFQVPGSGSPDDPEGEVVYLDPKVYEGTPAQCKGPCQLVLPPTELSSTTTISVAPYKTSLEVAPGTTTTITVQIPAIVTKTIDYFNVRIPSGQTTSTIIPTPSINIKPITTTLTVSGSTQIRTLTLPPYPLINSVTLNLPGGAGPSTTTKIPDDPWKLDEPPSEDQPEFNLPEGTPKPPYDGPLIEEDDDEPTPTWPSSIEIVPVKTEVPQEGEDDDGDGPKSKTTCSLWFFWVCINWPELDIKISGWEWNLPVGVWGPGNLPAGKVKLPPGFTIKGTLPAWPKITVLPGGKIAPPPKPEACTPAEASLCFTTSSFATTVSSGITRTTATEVKSKCATITGCNLKDVENTKTVEKCALTKRHAEPASIPQETGQPEKHADTPPLKSYPNFLCESDGQDGFVLLSNPRDAQARANVLSVLNHRIAVFSKRKMNSEFTEFRAKDLRYTGFFVVRNMGPVLQKYFNSNLSPGVDSAYFPKKTSKKKRDGSLSNDGQLLWPSNDSNVTGGGSLSNKPSTIQRPTPSHGTRMSLMKRANIRGVSDYWHQGMISLPQGYPFNKDFSYADPSVKAHEPTKGKVSYHYDDSQGAGQTIYIMENSWFGSNDPEYKNADPVQLQPNAMWGGIPNDNAANEHGYLSCAYAVGHELGIAPRAKLVHVPVQVADTAPNVSERLIEALILIAEHQNGKMKNKAVVNMSFGVPEELTNQFGLWHRFIQLMRLMEQEYGTIFVTAAGNHGGFTQTYPQMAARGLGSPFNVGAVTRFSERHDVSVIGNVVTHWAPGVDVPTNPARNLVNWPGQATGSSFAAPMVAGLIAYVRGHPDAIAAGIASPATVMSTINKIARQITYDPDVSNTKEKIVFNGVLSEPLASTCSGPIKRDGSCPNPGSGSGPGGRSVTFKEGSPSPLCSEVCGKLCSGFWCIPNPMGTNPDFSNPTSPAQPGGSEDNGGGNGGPKPSDLPDLPTPTSDSGVRPGKVCLSSTTTVNCNGGPRGGVCQTSTSCISTGNDPNFPTLAPWQPPASPSGATCASSTTWTVTGGPKGDATVTSSACASWKPKETAAPPSAKPRCMAAHVFMSNCAFEPDTVHIQIWENGVEVCRAGDGQSWASDLTEFELDCGNGAKAVVKNNAKTFEYTASDGWKPETIMNDYTFESTTCMQLENKELKGSDMESIWRGGNCSLCNAPAMCGIYTCKNNDVSCKSS